MIKDINFDDFSKIDIRVGSIIDAYLNKVSKKPAFILIIDFGPLGTLQSSAQITQRYTTQNLVNRQVIAVVNIGTRKIVHFESQCLVLGAKEGEDVILLAPESQLHNGQQIL